MVILTVIVALYLIFEVITFGNPNESIELFDSKYDISVVLGVYFGSLIKYIEDKKEEKDV